MKTQTAARLAWTTFAVCLILQTAGLALTISRTDQGLQVGGIGYGAVLWLFGLAGALVVSRRPGNVTGKLMLVICVAGSLTIALSSVALAEPPLPGRVAAAWVAQWIWVPGIGSLIFLLQTFPNGSLLSRRWRMLAWLTGLSLSMLAIGAALTPGPLADYPKIRNPMGVAAIRGSPLETGGIGWVLMIASIVGSAISLILRYRRARGDERLQLKWLAPSAAAFAFAWVVVGFFERAVPSAVREAVFGVGLLSLPISIGIAILKYRLYEIDVVINKTVVYGGLAAFITAVYVGVVVGIGTLVGAGDEPNLGLSLLATAIVAVAFHPVRERVQRFANRLVYGERVTPYEAITSFSHRMAESLSLDQVLPQMAEAAAKGVGGNRSQVKLLLPRGAEQVVSWPTDSSGDSFDRTISVTHQGEEVGEISVAKAPGEQITKSEENLLQDLASQAGLAMRNLRLTGELQQRLIELQESRKRIVAAQDEERRRMERDITDGPQQQLGKIAAKLGLAHSLARSDADKAARLLDEVKVESDAAIESVRDLARGLFPKILADRGLSAAIEAHISKTGIRAIVQDETNGARFSPDVEANVYFCIREALHMAPKRPAAAPIAVSLAIVDFTLEFSVRDGGHSERATLPPSVQNIQDRLEALGGSFDIQSAPEGGTELLGLIPIKAMEPAS